jgi:hypothetical protein
VDSERERQRIFWKAFVDSEDGAKALAILRKDYDKHGLVGDSVEMTYFNLGARQVVRRIDSILGAIKNDE